MHILTTVVGERTGHWTDLFAALCDQPGVTLTVLARDVPANAARELDRLSRTRPGFRHHVPRDHPIGAQRPDVVHVIGDGTYPIIRQTLRWRDRYWPGTPVTLHPGQPGSPRIPTLVPLFERYAGQQVDHAFPSTPAALEALRAGGYRGPATIVPPGVDTGRFTPSPVPRPTHRRFTAGFVDRLAPHTGVRDLLAAAERIDCDVLLVGDGPLAPQVDLAATRRPGRVHRQGWSRDTELPDLLARMDVLVLPTTGVARRRVLPWTPAPLAEQAGRTLVGAMAGGIPVIGSDTGGTPYLLGPAGLVFPAGNVAALTDRLARLRDDPQLADDLAAAGRARAASGFCWTRIAASLGAVWRQLVAQPRTGLDDLLGGPREVQPATEREAAVH
ncbi:glycosyltransferase family 4 protein [Micromonospora echinofusca]|uniref:Glycosyltransferase n=1 Tax=Micromonospora echinofusca TaxID=47858 RepID=A0ABS3VRQ8_MICEH|nr:glycosyltransferase family 4 protein [Micromonospora echinofusca]MBO4207217.1 glycosyltransferase [Micromonospora echinofusca]